MRILSFTPNGGTRVMLPPATEYTITGAVKQSLISPARMDGAWDQYGDTAPYEMQQIEFPFWLTCPTQSDVDNIRSAFTKRGYLEEMQVDRTIRRRIFKKTDLKDARSVNNRNALQFVCTGYMWPHSYSIAEHTYILSGASGTLTTLGNANAFYGLTIVFTASGSTTAFMLSNTSNGYSLSWAGSLSAGQTLTIVPAAFTVIKTGAVDEYPDVTLGANQIGLFKLSPGANALTRTITGSGSFSFTYRDTWH